MPRLPVKDFLKAARQVVPALEYTFLVRETEGATHVEVPEFKKFPNPGTVLKGKDGDWTVRFFTFRKDSPREYAFTPLVSISGKGGSKTLPWELVQNLPQEGRNGRT